MRSEGVESGSPVGGAVQAREFLNEVQAEFKKVTWPTQKETVGGTIGVIVLVAIVALALFAVDQILGWTMRMIWP
jgi:preprotein translocase subunit SecE